MSEKAPHHNQTYEQSREYLKGALEHLLSSGRSLRDLFEFAFDKFGEDFLPYLLQFFEDVREGRIKIEGLGKSTQDAIFGYHVTPEKRDKMIREAAYYKSEKHGFTGCTKEDWAEAEKEVDTRLEGLIGKSAKLLDALMASVEGGMNAGQKEISQWLEKKASAARKKTDSMKKTAGKKSSSKPADTKKKKKVTKKKAGKSKSK
jgi:hypothetical protein